MPSLGRVVRGLSALFWGLPLALLACARTAVADVWLNLGMWPPLVACVLVWFGLRQLAWFQPQERVWTTAVRRAELFAALNVALAPFTWWLSRRPEESFFVHSVTLLLLSGVAFLLSLNQVLRRLAALLPDETLRGDIRLFTRCNAGLLLVLGVLVLGWLIMLALPEVPGGWNRAMIVIDEQRPTVVVMLGLPPVALTMSLIWKAKEAILDDVFRGR
jgi:hypothetical protein